MATFAHISLISIILNGLERLVLDNLEVKYKTKFNWQQNILDVIVVICLEL